MANKGEVIVMCDREEKCGACGEWVWWDDTPNPLCASCEVIVPQDCGHCAHADHEEAPASLTACTKAGGYFNGRIMPRSARCDKFEARA